MIHAKELIDMERGYQSRRVFWDEEVYRQELARIFARSWLFLAHECEIPNPGDFVTRYMGQDPVIVARQKDKSVKAFINSCTHRGNKLCFADAGNTQTFSCNYHGWAFGLDGSLVGVPLEKKPIITKSIKLLWRHILWPKSSLSTGSFLVILIPRHPVCGITWVKWPGISIFSWMKR